MRFTHSIRRHACALTGVVVLAAPAAGQTTGTPERFTATAINLGLPGPAGPWTVEMVVSRWSTDAERDRLVSVLIAEGPTALLDTLRGLPRTGFIRTPDSLGYDLHFARRLPADDRGERIVLATDRYITFWEAAHGTRTLDYPFTWIELRLGPDGRGDGTMSLFTRIAVDKKTNAIVLEDYGTQPLLLQNVRRETGSN